MLMRFWVWQFGILDSFQQQKWWIQTMFYEQTWRELTLVVDTENTNSNNFLIINKVNEYQ